jgi:hypothetical protein
MDRASLAGAAVERRPLVAFSGVIQMTHYFGNSNGTLTTSTNLNFGPSSIWAYPMLQSFDEDGFGSGWVSSFVDNHVNTNVAQADGFGVFASQCTSINFFFIATNSIHGASAVTIFFS